jgi:glutathione synthase/RimK-type ligase-like ATP-grasp enzyme
MTPIALLISAELASTAPDRRADAYLFDEQLEILRAGYEPQGLAIETVRWVDEDVDWKRFAAVLIHCAWDYQDNHEGFLALLDSIAALGVPVFNPPDLARWNIRKTYLRDFESRGVPVIPTLWPEQPTTADVQDAFAAFGVDDVVLKRQVGAGARGQARYSKATTPQSEAGKSRPLLDRPGMIQPFIRSIAMEGEYSFLFVDGEFSHALVKRAVKGEYRIQEAYGGSSERIDPASGDERAARAVLDVMDAPPLYARVDMVRGDDGRLLLMELEVIEPFLFPKDGPGIAAMLGKALKKRLG